jgi:hypothetical protein
MKNQIRERSTEAGKPRKTDYELIRTSGEILRDGSALELVRDFATGAEAVLHWR